MTQGEAREALDRHLEKNRAKEKASCPDFDPPRCPGCGRELDSKSVHRPFPYFPWECGPYC